MPSHTSCIVCIWSQTNESQRTYIIDQFLVFLLVDPHVNLLVLHHLHDHRQLLDHLYDHHHHHIYQLLTFIQLLDQLLDQLLVHRLGVILIHHLVDLLVNLCLSSTFSCSLGLHPRACLL